MSSSHTGTARWFGFRTPTLRFLYAWAVADLAANVLLVVTGGAVRLTGSGLGCPTWPQCGDGRYTPPLSYHGVIEFGNRMLTWVLVVIAIATWVAAMRYRPVDRLARRLATAVALGVPAQAVIGGITVLTKLNPWVVAFHFLATMVIVSAATWLVIRTRPGRVEESTDGPSADDVEIPRDSVISRLAVALAWGVYAITWVTVYLGTVVTGSGPHSGDENSHRNGLDPANATQLHVDAVWMLIGHDPGADRAERDRPTDHATRGVLVHRGAAAAGRDRLRPVRHQPADRAGDPAHVRFGRADDRCDLSGASRSAGRTHPRPGRRSRTDVLNRPPPTDDSSHRSLSRPRTK
ncbi:COX15/CtaA family protein [Gordonia sp. (in: high G+C Gram-positive bacteria)]|uniref:COX15/CtaA family protein n=1 Tax=Gordonia sp. (in: high G+C Gram-positive bacteria) TaxID=84139 RepID=UPI0039E382AD